MRSKEDIIKEINDIEKKFNKSRNIIEKARFAAQIKELKNELYSLEYKTDKTVIVQNDAPSVADHKDNKRIAIKEIDDTGNSFIGFI